MGLSGSARGRVDEGEKGEEGSEEGGEMLRGGRKVRLTSVVSGEDGAEDEVSGVEREDGGGGEA